MMGGGPRSRTLRHTGVVACVALVCLVVAVGPAAADPVASCRLSETEIAPGESVTLDATASEDAEGYRFDVFGTGSFGDYTPEETRTVTYEEAGSYEPRVEIRTPEGETDTAACGTLRVADNQPPSAEFSYAPSEPTPDDTVTFSSESEDSDGQVVAYAWRIDGETVGERPDLEYSFPGPGDYTVALLVTDDDGAEAVAERVVTVVAENEPPTVQVVHEPAEPLPEETVGFSADAADPDGQVVEYIWTVDGEVVGETTTGEFTRAFPSPGEYTVGVTVTDDDGAQRSAETVVSVVEGNEPPAVQVAYEPTDPETDETVGFSADAADPDGDIVQFEWTVDGEVVAEGNDFVRAFPSPGEYTVGVTVTDDDGAEATAESVVAVSSESTGEVRLAVDPWNSPVSPRVGETVTVIATRRPDPRVTYRWDLDDDGEFEQDGVTVGHTFASEGRRTVRVRAVGPDGTTSVGSTTVPVGSGESGDGNSSSDRSFWTVPANPRPGETVTLFVSPDVATGVEDYRWDFDGDGETDASGQVATYNVSTTGQAAIELGVDHSNGSTTTFEQSVTVVNTTATGQDRNETEEDDRNESDQDDTDQDGSDDETGEDDTDQNESDDGTDEDDTDQNESDDETDEDDTDQNESDDGTTVVETTTQRDQTETTANRQRTATTTDRASAGDGSTTTASGDGPGFGQTAALVALLAAALLVARRDGR